MDEALDLSESVASRGANVDESFEKTVRQVRCRAAFISLKKLELRKAQEQFIRGCQIYNGGYKKLDIFLTKNQCSQRKLLSSE